MMNTVWTIDHRFGDAAIGVNFIKIVKAFAEDPENFNLEAFPDYTAYKPRAPKSD
jgi:pyruvate/2-oxoglutarate dehydrogenase complex dihydrolipoamide acyltransferase (E2) component